MANIDPETVVDIIDWNTFGQILEMDDDEDDREFSRSIVWNFFEQAENTFTQMDAALTNEDLDQLSSLGHFLKGSSAALGLTKVKNSCEKIQHLGAQKDEVGTTELNDPEYCLKQIKIILESVRQEYAESESFLRKYYDSEGSN
ncbi:signal transduction histidine kinase [Lipomyces tetrasporus]|uniref:Signal transduction histidine kinase n=1 Tax=Lipomyces tetrasporus TaxID=54092 RepID=A0AAD7QLF9_9ASCO|nr:signal transduction histidine kinase [Lipomyces tetrasporus]KAJ8097452.1 signal transduction histidine kinase [Lipomyces tetrasporus]